jgi:hypothetical protein
LVSLQGLIEVEWKNVYWNLEADRIRSYLHVKRRLYLTYIG